MDTSSGSAQTVGGMFDKLVSDVLKKPRSIEFEPGEIADGRTKIFLLPKYRGQVLPHQAFDASSLPFLDLKAAGIDGGRPKEIIVPKVEELLSDRKFLASAAESFLDFKSYYLMQLDGIMMMAKTNIVEMKANSPWIGGFGYDQNVVDRDIAEAYAEIPMAAVSLSVSGDEIPGLMFPKPLRIWRSVAYNILVPEESPERELLDLMAECFDANFALAKHEKSVQSPWYRTFHWKRWRERRNQELLDRFEELVEMFAAARKETLPAKA
jgi:hypothetical protein